MSDIDTDSIARGLDRVSNDIKREVGDLSRPTADRMVTTLRQRYPFGAKHNPRVPHMRDDMVVTSRPTNDPLLPANRVRGPRLTYIWQEGSRERFDATRGNARRGRMPTADPEFFERTAAQARSEMMRQAQSILDRPRSIG